MDFLKNEYNSVQGNSHTDLQRGSKSAEMRELRSGMNLKGLFKLDGDFMNGDLRDFLNLKEDGTMNYKKEELTKDSGWKELCSIGSQYHQTNASNDPSNLNAKFVNKDGREVVINRDGIISNSYPDKGTFNYCNPASYPQSLSDIKGIAEFTTKGIGHFFADMIPYFITGGKNERNQ